MMAVIEKYNMLPNQVKLLYVGMTRAKQTLLIASCEATPFTQRIVDLPPLKFRKPCNLNSARGFSQVALKS